MPIDPAKQILARWADPDPAHVPLLKQARIQAVLLDTPHAPFEQACHAAGIDTAPAVSVPVVARGLWPGIRSQPRRGGGDEIASASREPWVDANGYIVACERVLDPSKPTVLGYRPDDKSGVLPDRMIPFETLEAALAEARVMGGNFVLAVEPRYRAALLKRDPKALAAWSSLGAAAAWLQANAALFARPALPTITALIEPGYPTQELVNLLYRRNASPAVASAASPPSPDPAIQCLIACSLKSVPSSVFAHAERGATVVIDSPPNPAWKAARKEKDRGFYPLGRGQVVVYDKRIADPSEFALDMIDIVNHRNRAARLWNAPAVIPVAVKGERPGQALLHLLNYGAPVADEMQARIQGKFATAELLLPGKPPRKLATAARGATTEVFVPELGRVGTVRFSSV